ncbi:hypothetical protein CAPTEDRAFT_217878 [Capitella teleta]|uniref:TNF family profile domain-containing protein n=1 Tax=Capitella teleta TaxID=283909 RepID=R7VFX0_CAPTE|nr:hypothetical protein CAPTEDRAFT_217878 [Capitella teleta]|eukprot:ELU17733.1 hypothetical protein CAPTEDRAFT_217878 [Capitella teleta]
MMLLIMLNLVVTLAAANLAPESFSLILKSDSDPHCTPCNQLQGNLLAYFDHNGDGVCCVKTPEDILRLIDVQIARQGVIHATEQRPHVSFHAVLSLGHRENTLYTTDILASEWTLHRDTSFCHSQPQDFCLSFNSRDDDTLALPFTGQYTINCRLAWRSSNTDVRQHSLRIARSAKGSPYKEFLAADEVTSTACFVGESMCAQARVHTTVSLNRGDRLLVIASRRDLLIEKDELSFFEVTAKGSDVVPHKRRHSSRFGI